MLFKKECIYSEGTGYLEKETSASITERKPRKVARVQTERK